MSLGPDPARESLLARIQTVLQGESFPSRRLGRALAFETLYEADLTQHPIATILERRRESLLPEGKELGYRESVLRDALGYAQSLVDGVRAHAPQIDGVIRTHAPMFPLAQMSVVDRNVLRIGLYEALFGGGTVPVKVAINEAVEMAKFFGSENSARFVNGVLGRAVQDYPGSHEDAEVTGASSGDQSPEHG